MSGRASDMPYGNMRDREDDNNDTKTWKVGKMTELSKVTRVVIIDGYGRTYTSDNPDHIQFSVANDGQTLKITHDGDSSYGSEKGERFGT